MSALGKLVASVILDTAEFTVGTDKAKYLAAQTASDIDKQLRGLENSVKSTLGGVATAIAAGFGLSALKSAFDSYAEGSAKLVDLAAKAGTSIEVLSQLSPIAKISGTSMDDLAAGMAKLSKGVVNATDTTQGAGKALAFLGISATDSSGHLKDSGTLTEEIAGKLSRYQDGIVKTTIAQDLYGKSGANLIPFLKDLAEYGVKDATITGAQARAAKEYEQDLVRLGIAKGAVAKIISSEFLPVADAVVKTMLDMTTKTGGLRDKTKQLAEDGSLRAFAMMGVNAIGLLINAGDSVIRIFSAIGEGVGLALARVSNSLGAIADAIVDFIRGDYSKAWTDLKNASVRDSAMVEDAGDRIRGIFQKPLAGDEFVASVEANLAKIDANMGKSRDNAGKTADGYKTAAAAAAAAVQAIEGYVQSLGRQTIKEQEQLDSLRAYGVAMKESTVAAAMYEMAEGNVGKQLQELAKTQPALAEALAEEIMLRAQQKDAVEAQYESEEKYQGARKAWLDSQVQTIQKLDEEVQREKDAIATYGLSRQAITEYTISKLEARKAILLMTEGTQAEIAALDAQIAKLKEQGSLQGQHQELERQSQLWAEISDRAGHFFADLVTNGKSAFSNLRDEVKSFAAELISIFAKRWILQMAAGVPGMGAMGAMAGGVGQNTLGGAVMSGLTSGASSLFGTALMDGSGFLGTGLGASLGANMATLGVAFEGGAAAVGGFAEVVAAAIPVIGWVVAIGAILYSIFGSSGGGPKSGGSFMGAFDAAGRLVSNARVPGTDNGRFYTPNQSDSSMQQLATSTAGGYSSIVRALGGNPSALQFGFGFDTDPNGTAPNRVSSQVRDAAGNLIYGSRDRDIGRDQNQIQPELQLEASRAMLAALKASDLPGYLQRVFDGLTPSSATQAQINDALAQATALKTIFDVVTRDPLKDIAAMAEANSNKYQAALKGNATAIQAAMSQFDHTTASTQTLAKATIAYYNAQLQLISGIDQVRTALKDMFGSTIRTLQMGGMDRQGQYDFLRSEAAALQQQALNSNDPETIRRLAQQINANIQAAFNLLSPEQQNAQRANFISGATTTQNALDARLEALRRQAISDTQDVLKQIKTLIEANAETETRNAATQQNAANTQLAAAQTPKQLVVTMPNGTQQVVTF